MIKINKSKIYNKFLLEDNVKLFYATSMYNIFSLVILKILN